MPARMSEKEYASFLADRYTQKIAKLDDAAFDQPFTNGLDEHDVLRLFKQQHVLRDALSRLTIQMWVGFGVLALIMVLHR